MPDRVVRIGSLRWPVIIGRRRQNFDPIGAGVSVFEDWVGVETIHADIEQIRNLAFFSMAAMEQTETPITHWITTRWLGYLDNTYAIIRNTMLPPSVIMPGGGTRGELFRIRRVKELDGRKRFTSLDCELEKTELAAMDPTGSP